MPSLQVQNLKKYYSPYHGKGRLDHTIRALDGISFSMAAGEIHSIVGESGSGKTTLGRIIAGLVEPTDGKVFLDGKDVFNSRKQELRELRRKVQIIFQDPYSSLNPRFNIRQIISEPLKLNRIPFNRSDLEAALMKVGLTPPDEFLERFPHELSGGQRQRVAIARSIVIKPEFIVADEPVSMLDASMRASFLRLISGLRESEKITMLMISHDISIAYYVSDYISVLYLGKIVESGPTEDIVKNPRHPYTRALIQAVPSLGKSENRKLDIVHTDGKPVLTYNGCRFSPRCPFSTERCKEEEPKLRQIDRGHLVACHYDL
ncbi:MAG: ATP-binding cassette domain-containing protein [Thermoplasmataceae archaeon]